MAPLLARGIVMVTRSGGFGMSLLDSLTGASLSIYIIALTAFGSSPTVAWVTSLSLYAFLGLSLLNIIERKRILVNHYTVSRWLFCALLAVGGFLNSTEMAGEILWNYLTSLIVATLVICWVDRPSKIRLLLCSYAVGAGLLSVLFFAEEGLDVFLRATSSEFGIRFGDQIGNVNSVGIMAGLGTVISVHMVRVTVPRARLLWLALAALCAPVALLTSSRKGAYLVALALTLLVFASMSRSTPRIWRVMSALIVAVVVAALPMAFVDSSAFWFLGDRIEDLFDMVRGIGGDESALQRAEMVRVGLDYFAESPVYGHGTGISYTLFGTYSHSNYVELLISVGFIGLVVYYWTEARTVQLLLGSVRRIDADAKLLLVLQVSLLVLEVGLITYYTREIQILVALAACAASLSRAGVAFGTERNSLWQAQRHEDLHRSSLGERE